MDKWKIYPRKPQRPMRVITEHYPVPVYEELCFNESVAFTIWRVGRKLSKCSLEI